MRKARYCYSAAALLVVAAIAATVFVSCTETGKMDARLDNTSVDDEYVITAAAEIENGSIQVSHSKASQSQVITVNAHPAPRSVWKESGDAPEKNGAAKDGEELYPWYVKAIIITYGEKNTAVSWSKVATNKWIFNMPAGDVTVNAMFTQIPAPSNELAALSVVSGGAVNPRLLSGRYNYKADIPYTPPAENGGVSTFTIAAIPEDPNAEVDVQDTANPDDALDGGIELVEGERVYKISVIPAKNSELQTKVYTLTVSREPDLALESITLSASAAAWSQSLPVMDAQTVSVPLRSVAVAVKPRSPAASAQITIDGESAAGGVFTFNENEDPVAIKITVSKPLNGAEKIYKLSVRRDTGFPYMYLADGGGVNIIKEDGKYYETHLFAYNNDAPQELKFRSYPAGLQARVLIVGGGGGGGYGGGGGGAGGFLEKTLELKDLSYSVKAGKGGAGKAGGQGNGENGGDSSFGAYTAYGGGGGAGDTAANGSDGSGLEDGETSARGSGGGGGEQSGDGGAGKFSGSAHGFYEGGGGGGSSKPGRGAAGGAGAVSSITGAEKIYAAGGNGSAPSSGGDNTGNGGGGGGGAIGANYSAGGNGGSGIVIVSFPLP